MVDAVLEIAKMLLTAYFSYARLNGATDEEIERIYSQVKASFKTNTPDQLEDIE